jgi:hypothetical protein
MDMDHTYVMTVVSDAATIKTMAGAGQTCMGSARSVTEPISRAHPFYLPRTSISRGHHRVTRGRTASLVALVRPRRERAKRTERGGGRARAALILTRRAALTLPRA